jgi:hypothetical protein
MAELSVEKLVAVGGKEWKKGNFHRIYFNNIHELHGLDAKFDEQGKFEYAHMLWAEVEEEYARRVIAHFADSKFWYDVKEKAFAYKNMDEDEFNVCIDTVNMKIERMEEAKREEDREPPDPEKLSWEEAEILYKERLYDAISREESREVPPWG